MIVALAHDPRGPLPAILDRLDKVKEHTGPTGRYWTARCPAHQDRNPSLSISEGNDGRVLLNCHAGCTARDIVAALGLAEADLFMPKENGQLTEIATYPYTDEQGTRLYDVVRFHPKTFRQRRPDGTWGLGDTRRVIYRLTEVRTAIDRGDPIYIVEGEKDADAIAKTGAVATCNPMGAGKWRDEYATQLQGCVQAIIVADNDDPGLAHAAQVATSLEHASIPHRIMLAALGKDVAEHLEAGHTLAELVPRIAVPTAATVKIVSLTEFVNVTEDVAEPLIGTPEDALLPANGLLLMYGDGGAGKTTLSIDALAHLAAGVAWLNIAVPRPLRIMLIENEGPRGPFRQRLAQKIAAWTHAPFAPNVTVLEEPWTRFTITDPNYRHQLADNINHHQTDLVVVGPLASLGAKGTGTPDEINEFDVHIKDLRAHAPRPFGIWIVHHENKAGDVSGAWERYPDTLVHVQAQGNGRTRVYWRKVRWSSTIHGTSNNLIWTDGNSFQSEEAATRDYHTELIDAFTKDDQWRTLAEAKTLINANQDRTRAALSDLVESGRMRYQKGPLGRRPNAQCWRLKTDSEAPSQYESVTPLEGFTDETDSLTRPMNESESESVESNPNESNSPDPSKLGHIDLYDPTVQALLDDDIPF